MAYAYSGEVGTYVGEVPGQLGLETINEAGEETPATREDDVAHEHLSDLGVACAQRAADQSWNGFG